MHPYILGTPHNPPSSVSLQYPIVLTPRQKANFFVERQSFNALGMLQNPMILMMAVMGVLVIGLPYLMVSPLISLYFEIVLNVKQKNMDPEMAKEFQERQARMSSIQNAIHSGDFKGG